MNHYSNERKEAVLKKLLPPHNMTVAEVARQEGIKPKTLYNWRYNAKKSGLPVPGKRASHSYKIPVTAGVIRLKREGVL